MHFQLEAGQGRHDEEVAVEVVHGLFDHLDLELRVVIVLEQVPAHHGLVEVRSHFGGEKE